MQPLTCFLQPNLYLFPPPLLQPNLYLFPPPLITYASIPVLTLTPVPPHPSCPLPPSTQSLTYLPKTHRPQPTNHTNREIHLATLQIQTSTGQTQHTPRQFHRSRHTDISYPHKPKRHLTPVPRATTTCHSPPISAILINARSIRNKAPLIHDAITEENADLAFITETWAKEKDVALSQICPPGYKLLHQPRDEDRRGGGVALVYKDSIPLSRKPLHTDAGCEILYITLGQQQRLGILLVYRPPNQPPPLLSQLSELIAEAVLQNHRTVILGDFNIHAENLTAAADREFIASMTALGLTQLVTGPTHEAGHTLDLIFSTHHDMNQQQEIKITPTSWSDHHQISFHIPTPPPTQEPHRPVMIRPRKLIQRDRFLQALGEFPTDRTLNPAETIADLWHTEVTKAIDLIAPKRALRLRKSQHAPWFTAELREMKRARRKLERRWRTDQAQTTKTLLQLQNRAYCKEIAAAKRSYLESTIASANNHTAALFRIVNKLLPPTSGGPTIEPSRARCEDFINAFENKIIQIHRNLPTNTITHITPTNTPPDTTSATLPNSGSSVTTRTPPWDSFWTLRHRDTRKILSSTRPTTCLLDPCPSWLIKSCTPEITGWIQAVINSSLREGIVPTPWKQAIVRPLLKKPSLDPNNMSNYRPVANLPFISKVVEKAVITQLQTRLDETNYLDPFQSGFRPGHGTETALTALMDDLLRERDRGNSSLLILLDLSAAFDTVDHSILLSRLRDLGAEGTVHHWFSSYLQGRTQRVVIDDCTSTPRPLTCGVPQGAVLSPTLFNIYMKPLGQIIREFGIKCHQYADDTQLYLSLTSDSREEIENLNCCLEAVMSWMTANKLKLNPDKTETLWIGNPRIQQLSNPPRLDGTPLPRKEQVRNLGVLLDSSLSLEAQVASAVKRAFFQIRQLRQLRPYLQRDSLTTVARALVLSRIEYCNALYTGLPSHLIQRLQRVLNAAARIISGTPVHDHITPTLKQLNWLPVTYQNKFKILCLTYKSLNNLGPAYLSQRLTLYKPKRNLRSASRTLLHVPPPSKCRLAQTRNRAFSAVAPTLWNSLPPNIQEAPNLPTFKRLLRAALFSQAYN